MITLYGIKNCDTCRKALKWLDAEGIANRFHDFRKDGLTDSQVSAWLDVAGADMLLNKRGTTWRNLDAAQKEAAESDRDKLAALLLDQPTLIKRPVMDTGDRIFIGFTDETRSAVSAA